MVRGRLVKRACVLLSIVACACACARTKPQRPTHLSEAAVVDSSMLSLVMLNQRLADEADKCVRAYIERRGLDAYMMDCGAWTQGGGQETEQVQRGEERLMVLRVSDLKDSLLCEYDVLAHMGANELPPAVEERAWTMRGGDSAVVICPYYTAYGAVGREEVKPYENCIITIYILE